MNKLEFVGKVVAYCLVVLLLGGLLLLQLRKPKVVEVMPGSTDWVAFSNGEAAFAYLTNRADIAQVYCGQGVVQSKKTGNQTKSMVACVRVEPYTTAKLEAPYQPGQVSELCPTELGIGIDWSKCTFDMERVPVWGLR